MSYPTPTSTDNYLEDGASAVTTSRYGQYGGGARVFDTGSSLIAWPGIVVASFSAMDTTSGDEHYTLRVYGNTASDFSGTNKELLAVSLDGLPTNNEQAYNFSNQADGTIYRYLRAQIVAEGTTPSVTVDIWALHLDDLDDMTLAQLTKFMSIAAQRLGDSSRSFSEWAAGTVDGGPEGDGRYPLYDGNESTYLIPCPAKIAASAGLSYEAFIALTEHTLPFGDVAGPDIMIGTGGALKRGKLFLFAARRTTDMEPLVSLLSEELIPSVHASTGLERKIAIGEIMRQTMGMVNPLHYGVKHDCLSTGSQTGFSYENGDDIVECDDPIFYPGCVGKTIQIGGALGGGTAGKGTILEYIDAYHARVSFTFTATNSHQYGNFGTLNTMAMQNAINACFNPSGPYNYGAILMLPSAAILTGALYYLPRMGISGHGTRQSRLVRYDDTFMTTAGQFPRWDGDMDPFPITKYHDNTYYYPIYPNAYIAPYHAGSYVPDIAPTLCNRMGVDRWGDTWGPDDSEEGPAEIGYKVDSDLNVFNNFSMDGSRYCATRYLPGFEFRGGLFSLHDGNVLPPYNQVDPYLRMRDMEFSLHAGIPFRTFGQCSGLISNIGSYENNLCGYLHQGFDCNISNGYFMGNNGPGIVADGTNTNWTTMKISYNGDGTLEWYWGGSESRSNLYIPGIGHNWNNFRAQESYGANVFIKGRGNDFTGCHLDDTGCIYPYHIANSDGPTIAANMNWLAPAILVGPDADDLRMNDVGMGGLVHVGVNYATHAVYWLKNGSDLAERTSGRMFTKDISTWFNPGHASYTGDRAPNEWNAQGGVAPATSTLTLDGVDITTL